MSLPATHPARVRLAARLVALATIMALGGCGTPGPEGRPDTYGLDFSLPAGSETTGAIVFLVDGLNAEYFQRMLEAGELPAFRKYFADRGLYAPRAVANVPSITLVNLTSIATGRLAGHHGIIGNHWFDRNRLIGRSYETIAQKNTLDGDYLAPTVFEMLPDETSFSVFFQPHRKATKFVENWTSAGPPFFFRWYEFVDRLTLFRLNIVADVARQRRAWPAVTVAYLLAPDFRAYDHGFSSDEYRAAILHADRQIGRVCSDLERAGLLDKLHLLLVSDHGHADVHTHFPLRPFLDELGLHIADKALWEKAPFEKRLEYYEQFQSVTFGSGDRYFAVALRKPASPDADRSYENWTQRPAPADLHDYPVDDAARRIDLPAALLARDEVDVVAYRNGDNRVRVARASGEVEFRQDAGPGGEIAYHLIRGDDPLGWRGKAPDVALNGEPISPRAWLEATHASDYPDLPTQLLAYFRSRYAGDLAVFAAPGCDFFANHQAGHGGLQPDDMFVPILVAGPGVPHGRVEFARSVDVVPTILHLLGRARPADLDGQSLLPPADQ